MDEARKAWCEKYKVNIVEGGFADSYLIPEHVQHVLPSSEDGGIGYYIGFDGKAKTWQQLTDEEKQDYEEQLAEAPKRLEEFMEKRKVQQSR